jgi:hypothetical protein
VPPHRVVILRHGEKPDDPRDPHLSHAGKERAKMLATVIPQTFKKPDFLYAAATSEHSMRPVKTVTPVSHALNLDIHDKVADADYEVLAADLLHEPKFGGKLVVVCWHHEQIPDFALALGAKEADLTAAPGMNGLHWNSDVFDRFWILDFQDGGVAFQSIPQQSAAKSKANGDQCAPLKARG